VWLYFVSQSYLSDGLDSKALIRILIWPQGGSEFEAMRRDGEDTDRADSPNIAVVEECVPSSPTDSEESVPSSTFFSVYSKDNSNPSRMREFKTVSIPGRRYFKSDGFRRFIGENLPDIPEIERPD